MNNFFIVTPTFNDWKSLNKLLFYLNKNIKGIKGKFGVIIVNDNSSEKLKLDVKNLSNINNIKILNLKKNIGSQKAIYVGLKFIEKSKQKSIISILDSDGEDDPSKLKKLISLAAKEKENIFVANRSSRHENMFLRSLNKFRLIVTFFLTGKYMNFGNFSAFSSDNFKNVFSNDNLWLAYSSGVMKNCKKIVNVNIKKRRRFYGVSKVNFKFLLNHSIKIICVFRREFFIRTFLLTLLSFFFLRNKDLHVELVILFLFLNILMLAYYKINNLNFNALKLIKNITNLKI